MRDFWIEFQGNPEHDLLEGHRLVLYEKPEQMPGSDYVHVREVDPDREAAIQKMVEALKEIDIGTGQTSWTDQLIARKALADEGEEE